MLISEKEPVGQERMTQTCPGHLFDRGLERLDFHIYRVEPVRVNTTAVTNCLATIAGSRLDHWAARWTTAVYWALSVGPKSRRHSVPVRDSELSRLLVTISRHSHHTRARGLAY